MHPSDNETSHIINDTNAHIHTHIHTHTHMVLVFTKVAVCSKNFTYSHVCKSDVACIFSGQEKQTCVLIKHLLIY